MMSLMADLSNIMRRIVIGVGAISAPVAIIPHHRSVCSQLVWTNSIVEENNCSILVVSSECTHRAWFCGVDRLRITIKTFV
jgi:hypothetical protein